MNIEQFLDELERTGAQWGLRGAPDRKIRTTAFCQCPIQAVVFHKTGGWRQNGTAVTDAQNILGMSKSDASEIALCADACDFHPIGYADNQEKARQRSELRRALLEACGIAG